MNNTASIINKSNYNDNNIESVKDNLIENESIFNKDKSIEINEKSIETKNESILTNNLTKDLTKNKSVGTKDNFIIALYIS